MKKLQIIFGMVGIILGVFTAITAIMYLNGDIDDLGICMMGMAFCCVINCCNCLISVLNIRSKESN